MDAAARHADYADARHVERRLERLSTRNGDGRPARRHASEGIGVRVRVGRRLGIRGRAPGPERAGAEAALRARARISLRAQPAAPADRRWRRSRRRSGSWASAVERDPFAVPLEEKLAALHAADAALRGEPRREPHARPLLGVRGPRRMFASTEGALCEQHDHRVRRRHLGGGASSGGESQVRSYPASHGGHVAQAGYEHFLGARPGRARRRAWPSEAGALLTAPACPRGGTTLILAGEQLGLPGARVGRATRWSSTACSAARPRTPARASWPPDGVGSLRYGSPS